MRYWLKLSFLAAAMIDMVLQGKGLFPQYVILLLIVASNIYREKYNNRLLLLGMEFALITWAAATQPYCIFLYGAVLHDAVYRRAYWGVLPVLAAACYFTPVSSASHYLLIYSLSILAGYHRRMLEEKDMLYRTMYDNERRYRYELESAKARLLSSSREMVHIAEVKERNRIAREIHDHAGHSISGILMQLQACAKLFERDGARAKELLEDSVQRLADALTLLRETVHNIKPRENMGLEYIQNIIASFSFCEVLFSHKGDFTQLSPVHLEILSTNIKEALTNIARHSGATQAVIQLEVNEKFIRLYIKDNGKGCTRVSEGMGLQGMKERVLHAGGSMTMSGENGFMIVCLLPAENEGRGNIFENIGGRR